MFGFHPMVGCSSSSHAAFMKRTGLFPAKTRKTTRATPPRAFTIPQIEIASALAVYKTLLKFTLRLVSHALMPWREIYGWLASAPESEPQRVLVPVRSYYRRDY
jgi:hypothetical protein